MNNQQLWQAILGNLEVSLSKANFNTWFKNTSIQEKGPDFIVLGVPNAFFRNWISTKYHQEMLKALKTIAPEIKEIKYRVGTARSKAEILTDVQHTVRPSNTAPSPVTGQKTASWTGLGGGLNPKNVFESFIVGKNNELAHAAAMAVAKAPGGQYNPLFIYGGVGLGKTHLMQAIGNQLLATNPSTRVFYVTSERFTNDYIEALRGKRIDDFKKNYRDLDALLIDDIQFLAGKEGTQEEFFHTFNDLRDKNKQIVITSDRPPKEIPAVEQRLISRFEWGMVADIQAPDLETRLAILRTKMEKRGVRLDEEILLFIAQNIQNNVRELEGALNRLVVYQQLENRVLGLEQAKSILANIISSKKRVISPKRIAEVVAEFYNVQFSDLIIQSRKKEFVKPRQIAMYIMRKNLESSFPSIGEFFGGRDHTTVMHAVEKVVSCLNHNPQIKQEVDLIMNKLLTQL